MAPAALYPPFQFTDIYGTMERRANRRPRLFVALYFVLILAVARGIVTLYVYFAYDGMYHAALS